jgi:hypothetical protein
MGLYVFRVTVYNLYQSYVEPLIRFLYVGTVVIINCQLCRADMDQNTVFQISFNDHLRKESGLNCLNILEDQANMQMEYDLPTLAKKHKIYSFC